RFFINGIPGLGRFINEIGTGKNKLFDLKILQHAQKLSCPLDCHFFIQGARLSGKIIIGHKVDNRSYVVPVSMPYPLHRRLYAFFFRDIEVHKFGLFGRKRIALFIHSYDLKILAQLLNNSCAYQSAATRYDDNILAALTCLHSQRYPVSLKITYNSLKNAEAL